MKEDIVVALREWTLQYLQNKDLLTRAILTIEQGKDGWDMLITTKTEPRYVLIVPDLTRLQAVYERLGEKNVLLVTINRRQNVDMLASLWQELLNYPKLSIMFVNPYSNLEKKWIIMPHVHEKITERKALKLGLYSLLSTVEEYNG